MGSVIRSTFPDPAGRAPAAAVVELACRAPSLENSQSWHWRITDAGIELYADRGRRVVDADSVGRNLMISCGCALHHAQVAARGLGWHPHVVRRPDPDDRDLLARIELERTRLDHTSRVELEALLQRRTDRRRFTTWPIDLARLEMLREVARAWGGDAEVVLDLVTGLRVERLVARARQAQVVRALPTRAPTTGAAWASPGTERDVLGTDALLVLVGARDDEAAWLASGEALGALWLKATIDGLSVLPLGQVLDVPETRMALQHDVLRDGGLPHLLLRVGWQQLGQDPGGRTTRRALSDVLRDVRSEQEAGRPGPVGDQGPSSSGPAAVGRTSRRP